MRTTLIIDDQLFRELKRRAVDENRTLSDVTQEVPRRGLMHGKPRRRRGGVRLRSFSMGKPKVDLADRDQLHEILDRG